MKTWAHFRHGSQTGFGLYEGDRLEVHDGNLFENPRPTGCSLALNEVQVELPGVPGKLVALWNNYHEQATRQKLPVPAEPLYFLKSPTSYARHEQVIPVPKSYDGRVVYEGELGLVIGRVCRNLDEEQAAHAIFGVTCVNDFTALDLIGRDASFAQWTRAKSFDGFGAMGPVIASGLDWRTLNVRTLVNGRERQSYPCSDMIFSPERIVSALSRDMTLMPGDVIACGTSVGVLPIKPDTVVEVLINGVGTLRNTFAQVD